MKRIVFALVMIFGLTNYAQDFPVDGDLVFTQVGSDSPDVIEFITLKRLNLTTLKITDKGILSDGTLRSGEGFFDLSNTSWNDVAGGTFIRLGSDLSNDDDDSDRILNYDGTGSEVLPNLTNANDQCIAYTGTTSSPVYIAGINFGNTDWNSGATGTSDSKAPGTLSDCDLETLDNQYFASTINGDAATTRSAIINPSNWDGQSIRALGYMDLTGTINNSALPVELTSFTANLAENVVKLNWATATEVNNYGFEVERASFQTDETTPVQNWDALGFIPGHGNSNSPKNYEFVDLQPPIGDLEYRLKQIDTDGKYEYYNTSAKVSTSSITDINDQSAGGLPTEYSLDQNYPNPFNPSTVISYQLPVGSFVQLKVYNLLGKEIVNLVNKQQPAGKYSVNFSTSGGNTSNISSGIYIYKLTAGEFVDVKKLVLMK